MAVIPFPSNRGMSRAPAGVAQEHMADFSRQEREILDKTHELDLVKFTMVELNLEKNPQIASSTLSLLDLLIERETKADDASRA